MIQRFQGDDGFAALRNSILEQQCVCYDSNVAEELLPHVQLSSFQQGDLLMEQGASDNHIFLILAGRVSILVNGREMAIRTSRQHVGEMALIDPSAKRSATGIALEETVVAKIPEPAFSQVADKHPKLWRQFALETSNRLRERSKHVQSPNPRPVVFIGCSTEGLRIAEQIQIGLSHADVVPQIWTNNVFTAGRGAMEALEGRIRTADFGILICTPDDHVTNDSRGVDTVAPRDNVILELGMCIGAMKRERAILVRPRGIELKIPTDLLGITPLDYKADDPANLAAHLGPVCTQIKLLIEAQGTR